MDDGNELSLDDTSALRHLTGRLANLAVQNDLTHTDIANQAINLFNTRQSGNAVRLDPGLIRGLIKIVFADCIWLKVKEHEESNEEYREMEKNRKTANDRGIELLHMCFISLLSPSKEVQNQAFSATCDILPLMSIRTQNRKFNSLCTRMVNFINQNIFDAPSDEHCDTLDIGQRQLYLTAFCKLIMCRRVNIEYATHIFVRYISDYDTYGEIIKQTMTKAKSFDLVGTSETMLRALCEKYETLLAQRDGPLRVGDFNILKGDKERVIDSKEPQK